MVDGVLKQVNLVREVGDDLPVSGALCFVEADWPLVGGAFTTRGVHVLWPKRLAKFLTETGEGVVEVASVREDLVDSPAAAVAPSTGPALTVGALPGGLSVGLLLAGWSRTVRDLRFGQRLVIKAFRRRSGGKHGRGSS